MLPNGLASADLAVQDGVIAAIGRELPGSPDEVDARGLHVFPGVMDVHVHFNEPGRADWEGGLSGSSALAAGGGTMYFDMPLNSSPCTVGTREFDEKRAALERCSVTDFGLWGGLVPANLAEMGALADRGVIGFKAFLSDSGLPEFPRADDLTLYEGLREAARLDLPVAVHAESEEITRGLTQRAFQEGRRGIRDYLDSRPVLAEVEAIERVCLLAREAGAKLHIVHVSSGRGVAAALEARARGTDVSIETCPHYLFFTEEDMLRMGAVAKCAPPLRADEARKALWAALLRGEVDLVSSDHSPAPLENKQAADFFAVWGGIAGVQSTLPLLLQAGHSERGLPLSRVAELTAGYPASRFGIHGKGTLTVGRDADLALVDLGKEWTLTRKDLLQRHGLSPYTGSEFRGQVTQTFVRGTRVFSGGKIVGTGEGRLIRPKESRAAARTLA